MITLTEFRRETYGNDVRSINKHSERWYRDANGMFYILSRTVDGIPPFFEAYGPFKEDHSGLLPRLRVKGDVYFGDDWGWQQAMKAFCRELQAIITSRK
jgi:hypothetical protein